MKCLVMYDSERISDTVVSILQYCIENTDANNYPIAVRVDTALRHVLLINSQFASEILSKKFPVQCMNVQTYSRFLSSWWMAAHKAAVSCQGSNTLNVAPKSGSAARVKCTSQKSSVAFLPLIEGSFQIRRFYCRISVFIYKKSTKILFMLGKDNQI